MAANTAFYSIIDYTAPSADAQKNITEAFSSIQQDWVAPSRGFVSARFLASTDGHTVRAIVEWESEEAFAAFEWNSDSKGRIAALNAVFEALSTTGSRQTFRFVSEVLPPQVP